jgi:hypothetical protein
LQPAEICASSRKLAHTISVRPFTISLVLLGNLKYPLNVAQLQCWKSDVFRLQHRAAVGHLPDAVGKDWEYTDQQLLGVLGAEQDSDLTLGLISLPLENNYYMRRLSNRVAVLSLHQMAEIVVYSGFSIEQYVLRNAYELAVLFAGNGKLIPVDYVTWAHDEIRGCLFDMNSNKPDIIFSLNRPKLCAACTTRLSSKQVSADLLPTLCRELPRIKKALHLRMTDWVMRHPIFALAITAASGIALNLIASVIFEKVKHVLPWLG